MIKEPIEDENLILDIDSDSFESFDVSLTSRRYEGIKKPKEVEKKNLGMQTDRMGNEVICSLFQLVKEETMGIVTPIYHKPKDLKKRVSELIWNRFSSEIKKGLDIEQALSNKIEDLKKFTFRGIDPSSEKLEFIDLSLNDIMKMIKSLRERKILIHEIILSELKKNKEYFLKIFKTIRENLPPNF